MTEHLVLATLHTNDSTGAFTRLIDIRVEEFLLASAMIGAMSQRLFRKICNHCKTPYEPDFSEKAIFLSNGLSSPKLLYKWRGCDYCMNTGYFGRTVIDGVFIIDKDIRSLVIKKADSLFIRNKAIEKTMRPLFDDGLLKVEKGITSLEELMRVYVD